MADVLQFHHDRAPKREQAPLWREALGAYLRATREDQGGRLVDVAERAGISPQYLSEIERGLKEPSSEMIAAVGGALELDLDDLLIGVASGVRRRRATSRLSAPTPMPTSITRRRPADPVLLAA